MAAEPTARLHHFDTPGPAIGTLPQPSVKRHDPGLDGDSGRALATSLYKIGEDLLLTTLPPGARDEPARRHDDDDDDDDDGTPVFDLVSEYLNSARQPCRKHDQENKNIDNMQERTT